MAWRGSVSRSIVSVARSSPSSFRSPAALPRLRTPRIQRTRLFSASRAPSELGSASSLLPLHSVIAIPRLTSHLSVSARACCELSQGMERMVDARERSEAGGKPEGDAAMEEWQRWVIEESGQLSVRRFMLYSKAVLEGRKFGGVKKKRKKKEAANVEMRHWSCFGGYVPNPSNIGFWYFDKKFTSN